MSRVPFEKWEGLGNDFVVLRDLPFELTDAQVQRLCDRRFGVGADGVLLAGTAPPRMVVRNADGSRPEMCGNGLRCVVGALSASPSFGAGGALIVETDAGPKTATILDAGPDGFSIAVDMGIARPGPELVATVDGVEHRFRTIDMGNPHAVSFAPFDDALVDRVGPAVATFPAGGTNVEFCRAELVEGGRIVVVVWERGVGRTLACGTGACAVAAAACDTGRARFGEPVEVALPGGSLSITVAPGTRAVRMVGPARLVFRGEVEVR